MAIHFCLSITKETACPDRYHVIDQPCHHGHHLDSEILLQLALRVGEHLESLLRLGELPVQPAQVVLQLAHLQLMKMVMMVMAVMRMVMVVM